jgi:diguanylate cyclase (GGDEF)-like protein
MYGDHDPSRAETHRRPPEDGRAQAAADRAQAAKDLARAIAEREEAARERAEAARNRAESELILKLSTTDELTGTWMRQFGLEQVSRELERAQRTGAPLLLAFVDVIGLKDVNDTHGHQTGDALLHRVGTTMRANVRSYDVIVRYGGDEFICAMPNLGAPEARARFELIAASLAAIDPEHSITYGLAEAAEGDTVQELIARADAELLRARRRPPSNVNGNAPQNRPPTTPATPTPAEPPATEVTFFEAEGVPPSALITFKAQFRRFAIYVVKGTRPS